MITKLNKLLRSRAIGLWVIGISSMLACVLLSCLRWPTPGVHDEFSYLLMADTFAEGRLTNPTHVAWPSLESFHIIHEPSYCSKYPIAQGLVLAFGQVAFGHPIVGVWISTSLAYVAICWMLQGWVTRKWAFWTTAILVLHHGILLQWSQSYWGGSVALLGGALLFGAAVRLGKRINTFHSVVLAIGLTILANSRPFEGLMVSLLCAIWIVTMWIRRRNLTWHSFLQFATPVTLILTAAGMGMAYYNFKTTGSPLKMAYQVHEKTYSIASVFAWSEPGPEPEYRHAEFRDFYTGYSLEKRHSQATLWSRFLGKKKLYDFYFSDGILLAFMFLPLVCWQRDTRFLIFALIVVVAGSLTTYACHPHYYAPAAPLLLLLASRGIEYVAYRTRSFFNANYLLLTLVVLQVLPLLAISRTTSGPRSVFKKERLKVIEKLENKPGKHLVLVQYDASHNCHLEWVYNKANLDSAKIVWARDMQDNESTLAAFEDRNVWVLEPDVNPVRLSKYVVGEETPKYTSHSLGSQTRSTKARTD